MRVPGPGRRWSVCGLSRLSWGLPPRRIVEVVSVYRVVVESAGRPAWVALAEVEDLRRSVLPGSVGSVNAGLMACLPMPAQICKRIIVM